MWPVASIHRSGIGRIGVATLALLTAFAFLITVGAPPALAQAVDPSFSVQMVEQEIHGHGWEQGIEVTAEIDDPSNGVGVDWTDTQLALPPEWNPSSSFVQFQPFIDDYTIEAGDVVTLTQIAGATTYIRSHTVTTITVTAVNEATDIVTGTGDVGAQIDVDLWDDSHSAGRSVTVQADGTWSANFTGGGDLFNIAPGTGGEARQHGGDGNTAWSIRIPDPAFSVQTPRNIWSTNDGWVPGRTVTITVDANDNLGDGYLFQTSTEIVSWGPSVWESGWGFDQFPFTITPGHYVTVDDGVEVIKTLHVVDLVITDIDAIADVITGTAPAGDEVEVHACSEFDCETIYVTADVDGFWTANFTLDIQTEFGGAAQIYDDDGDTTHRGWQLNAPYFGVDVANEEMWAVNWPAGETLTFQVFADDTMADLLWTDTMTVFGTPWQNTEAGYRFWGDFNIQGGQYFTVTDGVTPKDLVVSSLSITDVNPFDDYYTGTVDPTIPTDVGTEVCAWARTADPYEGVELCAMPDAGTGEWTIDFTGVGDIIPGDHLGVSQRDADDDETSHSWGVPPWIYVELAEQDEAGNDLYPDRVHLEQWIGPVDIFLDGFEVMSDVVTNGEYVQVELDVAIGQTIRVVDAQNDKELFIELLTVDNVTAWDDPVQPSTAFGTADTPITDQRQVQVTASADYGWWTERWVPVSAGQYQADFANPGNGWRESEIGYFGEGGVDDIYLGGEVRAHLWDFDNDQIQAIWHTCNPRIIIVRNNDRIEAICFPEGSELIVELDDPSTPDVDWTSDPVIVTRDPENPRETKVVFPLEEFEAPAGAVVTGIATDDQGTPLVEVTTQVIEFTIDEPIDIDADRVTGTAPVGEQVLVQADGQWRHPIADENGFWLADFGQPGEGPSQQQTVDIGPGSSGGATLIDDNGSATTIAWYVSNAQFWVYPDGDYMSGNEFAPGALLTIEVNGTPVPGGPYHADGDGGGFDIGFDTPELDLKAGDYVTVFDGDTLKDHTVTELAITNVDPDTDVVTGIAAPGSIVDVWVHDSEAWLQVTACDNSVEFPCGGDELGTWHADFAAQEDLVPGSNGNSSQCDTENDCTGAEWSLPNAQFWVYPDGDYMSGNEFAPGALLTIEVNGTPVPGGPYNTYGDGGGFDIGFDTAELDLMAGDYVTVFDGDTLKDHTVTDLAITNVDPDTDQVHGVAAPNSEVDIWVHDSDAWRHVVVGPDEGDGLGTWTADFTAAGADEEGEEGTANLVPGSNGNSSQCDPENDCTGAEWSLPNAQFWVYPANDSIGGHEFAPGALLTIEVNGTPVPGGPYHADGDGGGFDIGFDPAELDLMAGDYVTVFDGDTLKDHTVTDLAITNVDPDNDVVTGMAAPGSMVDIWVHDSEAWLQVTACDNSVEFPCGGDELGTWHADFAAQEDLVPGSNGNSSQCDPENDCTGAEWRVLNPTFSVEVPHAVWSSNGEWELGDTITLTIDDPGFPGPLTTTVIPNEDDPENHGWWINLEGIFEIEPGHVVTVTDGEHTKVLTVVDLVLELVDPTARTVSGWLFDDMGDPMPDTPVEVNLDNENGNSHRTATTAANGYWVADFSVAGEGEGPESDPFDIISGTGISAQVFDEDWDSTHRGECFDCGDGQYIDPIELEAGDVLISETDGTLWVYDPDDGSLEEHPLPFGGVWDIQFVWQNTLFIANTGDNRIWVLDLPSGELSPLDDPLFAQPFGMTIESDSAVGWSPVTMWVADGVSGVLRFDDDGAVQIVDMPGLDGIVVAPGGAVYFTDLSGQLFVVDETQPDNYRLVANVGGYSLNGLVMLPDGTILATSMGPAALITIDPSTGDYAIHEYPELWTPEDSALGRSGEIYVIDSGFETQFGDQSGLYVRNADGTLTQLVSHHDYPEFGDTVDVLVVGPTVTVTKMASQSEVFAPDGDLIEYTVDIHNLLGPFGQVTIDDALDSKFGDLFGLGTCEPVEVLASGELYQCTYQVHIAGDPGEITNEVTVSWTDEMGYSSESSDSALVTVVAATVSIDKTVASTTAGPGDGILAAPGEMLTWSFVVTNDGDTELVDLVVEDDVFGEVCIISSLASGASATCYLEATAEFGEHTNVGTVAGTAVDADGDAAPVAAEDGSSYVGLNHVYATDSSLCVIDGFDLVFTPDMKNWPGRYKLSASNPGQFYWNGFVGVDDATTATMEIPYPFVTQGAMPLHEYGGVDLGDGDCFVPFGEGAGHGTTFGLGDYTDTNDDGMVGFGDVYLVEVDVPAGFSYLTLHLDYGLKGTKGWSGNGADAFNDPALNPGLEGIDVLDFTDHEFALWVDTTRYDDSAIAIVNHNEFKNVKGFGGIVIADIDGSPVEGAQIELYRVGGSLIETMATDTEGWYLSEYRHKGKQAKYKLILLDAAGQPLQTQMVTVGKQVKFGEANFYI